MEFNQKPDSGTCGECGSEPVSQEKIDMLFKKFEDMMLCANMHEGAIIKFVTTWITLAALQMAPTEATAFSTLTKAMYEGIEKYRNDEHQ